MSSKISYYVFH